MEQHYYKSYISANNIIWWNTFILFFVIYIETVLGLYAEKTLKEDLLSAAEIKGECEKRRSSQKNNWHLNKEFSSSKNTLVYTRVKNTL